MKKIVLIFSLLMSVAFADKYDDADNLLAQGSKLHDSGRYDEAIAKYKEADKLTPGDAFILYELSYSNYAKKNYKEAAEYGKKALSANNDPILDGQIIGMLGSIYDLMGDQKTALKYFDDGYSRSPWNYMLCFNAGVTSVSAKNDSLARVWFLRSAENTKTHETTYASLMQNSAKLGLWIDLFAYGLYTKFITQKTEIKQQTVKLLHRIPKNMVSMDSVGKDGKKHISINLNPSNGSDVHMAFMLTIATTIAADSVGNHRLYEADSNGEHLFHFLTTISKTAVEIFSEFEQKYYDSPLQTFYKGLVKEKLIDAFVNLCFADVDRPSFAQWRLKNDKDAQRFFTWYNETYLPEAGAKTKEAYQKAAEESKALHEAKKAAQGKTEKSVPLKPPAKNTNGKSKEKYVPSTNAPPRSPATRG
ncbi:MAG: tetratricopeptide repeat protein [Fibrobacter sp.]|nr:tetratricopeptide repeat protein [Fibrobacter sp.]